MTLDEGYVKYHSRWSPGPAPDAEKAAAIDRWRLPLYEAGLIGEYTDLGIGFGNLSLRTGAHGQFLISGTQTGHLRHTRAEHYSLVTACDIAANTLDCRGPVQASSEAMTHAAIYALDDAISAVVHVHSDSLWRHYLRVLPTSPEDVAYGTPEMARAFARLYAETAFATDGIAIMAGHREGLISIGGTLEQAALRILRLPEAPAQK